MEQYYEQLVQKIPSAKMKFYVVLVWAAAILGCIGVLILSAIYLLFEIGLFVCLLFVMLAMLFAKRSRAEYEYIFVSGELSADKIIAQGRRVHIAQFEIGDVLDFGRFEKSVRSKYKPAECYDHRTYRGADAWYFYFYVGRKKAMLIFEPDEALLALIRDSLTPALRNAAFR